MTEGSDDRLTTIEGSWLVPAFEHARVADAMRVGVLGCPPDVSMETVARIMATHHVHAVVVVAPASGTAWGVVTDRDVLDVAANAPERLAGTCAGSDPLMVRRDDRLADAVEVMRREDVTHVLVGDPESGHPIGVLSSLDVAGIVAWGRG